MERQRHALHTEEWSLETIAGALGVIEQWVPAPPRVLVLSVVSQAGAIVTLAERVRGSEIEAMVRARCLADVVAARCGEATGDPFARVVTVDECVRDRASRARWAGGLLLAISQQDVHAILAERATPAEIAAQRGVPDWLVRLRICQERAYGALAGDAVAAACELVGSVERFADWLASAVEPIPSERRSTA